MRRATKTFHYTDYHTGAESWDTNPENMVDGDEDTYASTDVQVGNYDHQLCIDNTCAGKFLGVITRVEVRVLGQRDPNRDMYLTPRFGTTTEGDTYASGVSQLKGWGSWRDITEDTEAPAKWKWSDVESLWMWVSGYGGFIIYSFNAWKVEVRVSYIVLDEKKKRVKKNTTSEETMRGASRDYDIPYGISSIALTSTGHTVVATTGGYYHGFTMVAGSVDAKVFVYDHASTASGALLDARVILADLSGESDRINPVRAKNGIIITVTGTGAAGAVFFSPKG